VSLGVEHVNGVRNTVFQAKLCGLDRVQYDRLFLGTVAAAQIDDKNIVNKHPHVVVATEREGRVEAGDVREAGVQLGGKVEVSVGI